MKNVQKNIKAKYQWTEAFLFIGMFAVVASAYATFMHIQEGRAITAAAQKPVCGWDDQRAAAEPKVVTDTNLILNSSMEEGADSDAPEGWTVSSWGNNLFQASYLRDVGHTGSSSIQINMTAANSGGAMWQAATASTVEAGASYAFQNHYRSDVDTSIVAEITLKDGEKQFLNLGKSSPSQDWAKQLFTFVAPDKAIRASVYQIIDRPGFIISDDYKLSRYQPKAMPTGLVSLTFDDGAEQIYTHALPLLEEYDINSTQYVVTKPIPDKYSGYYIGADQLNEMMDKGHEIGSHTHTHLDMASVSEKQSEKELIDAQRSLYELTGSTAPNFATPYGSYDQRVIDQVKVHYCSHRSTDLGYNSPDNFNLYNIRVQNITVVTPVEQVYGWIDYAARHKVWLVIVFHEIGYEGGHYSYTPENLEKVLQHLKKTDVKSVTMSEGIMVMQKAQDELN